MTIAVKDSSIKNFLEILNNSIPNFNEEVEIKDYDGKSYAIALKKGKKILYISTYNPGIHITTLYHYELGQYIDKSKKFGYGIEEVGICIPEAEMIKKVKNFEYDVKGKTTIY